MPYTPFHYGGILVPIGLPNAPKEIAVTVDHTPTADLELRCSWKGPPWHGQSDAIDLRSVPDRSPWLEARAWLATQTWQVHHGAVPAADGSLLASEAILRWRTNPEGPGLGIAWLTGFVAVLDPRQRVTFTAPGGARSIGLLDAPATLQKALGETRRRAITATLEGGVAATDEVGRAAFLAEAEAVAWLLGFASGGLVAVARADLFDAANEQVTTTLRHVADGERVTLGPLPFETTGTHGLGRYLEFALPAFARWDARLQLRVLIHTLLLARQTPVLEVAVLLCANFLEIARFQFAAGVLVPSGRAVRDGNDFLRGSRKLAFRTLLTELCAELGLATGSLDDVVDARNEIVHAGRVVGADQAARVATFERLLDFCDRIVLAMLDVDKAGISVWRPTTKDFTVFDRGRP